MKISDFFIHNILYIFTFFLILASLIYNYFYFIAIGMDNSSIPVSVIDYINNMEWYWIIPLILYFMYVEIPLKKIEKFQTDKEIIKSSSNPKKTEKIRSFPYKIICIISIIIIITFITKKIFNLNIFLNKEEVGISVFIITLCLLDWVLTDENISINTIIIIVILYILTSIGTMGYLNGINSKYKKMKEVLILNNDKKIHCVILRNFNNVILIKDINSYIFVFKENIKLIRYLK
jgi:hypothetical protein